MEGHLCACWWTLGGYVGESPIAPGITRPHSGRQTSMRSLRWGCCLRLPRKPWLQEPPATRLLPWRRRDGGSEGSRTGGLHQELGKQQPRACYWGRGQPGDQFSNYTTCSNVSSFTPARGFLPLPPFCQSVPSPVPGFTSRVSVSVIFEE